MKSKTLSKLSTKELVKLEDIEKFASLPEELKTSGLAFPKDFKSAVVVDEKGTPRYFVFDTYSLWDLFCAFDEKFEKHVSTEEYVSHNPVGWLIDEIETHLPVNPELVLRLKKGIKQAERLGLVPFEKIKNELGLG